MATGRKKLLGQILKELRICHEGMIQEALARQREEGGLIGQILVSLGHATEGEILKALGVLDQATHLSFATICTVPGLPQSVVSECTSDAFMSEEQVIDLTMRTSLPWLDAHVRGNIGAAASIEADLASEPITWTAALQ